MHRLAHILGATTLVAVVAACSNTATPQEAAVTAGPTASTVAPADPISGGPAGTPTAQASSSASPTARPVTSTNTGPADLAIQPDRIGPLKIGMSLRAAKATGMIVIDADQDVFDHCVAAHWKGQSKYGWMAFNGKYGLRALDSFGNQKTPEGIKPGSTLAAVRRAYPHFTWRIDGEDIPDARRTDGDALVDAVKGDGAHYRINIHKGKVADVQLESDRAGCYE